MAQNFVSSHGCPMGGCPRLIQADGAAQPAGKIHLLYLGPFDERMHLTKQTCVMLKRAEQSAERAHSPSAASGPLYLLGS